MLADVFLFTHKIKVCYFWSFCFILGCLLTLFAWAMYQTLLHISHQSTSSRWWRCINMVRVKLSCTHHQFPRLPLSSHFWSLAYLVAQCFKNILKSKQYLNFNWQICSEPLVLCAIGNNHYFTPFLPEHKCVYIVDIKSIYVWIYKHVCMCMCIHL